MQVYDEMVDSGVDWIGSIPKGWAIEKVKRVFIKKNEKSTSKDPVILSLARAGVKVRDISSNEGQLAASYDNYNPVEPGDVLLNPMDLQSGANCSISKVEGVISPAYVNLRPKGENSSQFFDYYFKLQYWSRAFFVHGRGISYDNRWTLGNETLLDYPVVVPAPEQQQKVADFLDTETAKIDNLIAKQERLLQLLEEKRRATITHAVTRGLNPNVELKETNIPWLMRAPKHYTMISLRYMLTFLTDYTANGSFAGLAKNVNYLDEGFARLVRLTDLRKGLKNDGIYVDKDAYNFLGKSKLSENDLLIANVGHYTGFVCKMPPSESPATLGPNMFLMRFDKSRYNNDFLEYILNVDYVQDQLKIKSSSAAQPKVNKDQLRSTIVFMPDINEQNKIVELLNEQGQKSEKLKQKIQTQITLLRERRTSLISHAVTGKIKV